MSGGSTQFVESKLLTSVHIHFHYAYTSLLLRLPTSANLSLLLQPLPTPAVCVSRRRHTTPTHSQQRHATKLTSLPPNHTPQRVSRMAAVLVFTISLALAITIVAFRSSWARMFTSDEAIVALTAEVLPCIAWYVFFDGMGSGVLNKILTGMGMVRMPALANFLSFYAVGIPLGVLFAFHLHDERVDGVTGLWLGLDFGMTCMTMSLLIYLLKFVSWQEACDAAMAKAREVPQGGLLALSSAAGPPKVLQLGTDAMDFTSPSLSFSSYFISHS